MKRLYVPLLVFSFMQFAPFAQAENTQATIARPAKIVTAQSTASSTKRVYPGTIEPSRQSALAFRISGQLAEIPVKSGMDVKKGDLLARLDDADVKNALAERQAQYDLAKTQYNQAKKLADKKFTTQAKFDEANAQLKAAKAALALARDQLKYTKLHAPFDGVVAQVSVENYQAVQAQVPVLQLNSEDSLDVRFSVPETLVAELKHVEDPTGICATVRFNAHPDKSYPACFKEFDSVPDPLTRTYSAVHTMKKITEFQVLPGMAVNVEVDLSELLLKGKEEGVVVPLEAVFEREGKTWVWRVNEEMQAQRTEVSVGTVQKGQLLISAGLQAGDKVIAAGVSYVREGMKVRPLVKERGL